MHHSLSLYSRYQRQFLWGYLFMARFTRLPLVGGLVRGAANTYGRRGHSSYLLTLAEAERIVDASGEIALGPCSCRQLSHRCDNPVMSEILVGPGAEVFEKASGFRKISKEEAKEVLRECHARKLTQSIVRCGQHFYAICNCCSCCCVPTRLKQKYGIDYALVRSKTLVEDYLGGRL